MHDRLDHHRMNDNDTLASALRALPGATPPVDAWTQLAMRTRRRRTTRRILWAGLPAALAAAIALFIAWPHLQLQRSMPTPVRIAQQANAPATTPATTSPATTAPAASPSAPHRADITALQASSAQWQAWVGQLNHDGAPLDGRALAQAVSLQDRIGMIDLQLSAAREPTSVADLWQRRIVLLQQLGLLHLQPYLVAGQPRPAHGSVM